MRFCVNKKHRFNSYALRCYKSFKIYSYLGIDLDNILPLAFTDFARYFMLQISLQPGNNFYPNKQLMILNC